MLDLFVQIGDKESLSEVEALMLKKDISRENIVLILKTIAKKSPEEAELVPDEMSMQGIIINDLDAFLDGAESAAEDPESPPKHEIIVYSDSPVFNIAILPVNNKKFKVVGNVNQASELEHFMYNHDVNEDDIRLILNTLQLTF